MKIDNDLLDRLTEAAKVSPRLRMNYDLRTPDGMHGESYDTSQRMLNALEPCSRIPVHRHRNTTETIVLLRGKCVQYYYEGDGNVTEEILLESPFAGDGSLRTGCDSGSCQMISVEMGRWHCLEALESGTVIFESKDGAYAPVERENILDLEKGEVPKPRKISFSPPDMSGAELKMVNDAILSGWITTGPRTKEFERRIAQYCGTSGAVCLNSATACMEVALRLLGIGPGDEVIVPAYTYTATASVVLHVGAELVMVDSREGSLEMDYGKLADAVTERTKAVIPVDVAGMVCDYDRIFAAVESKKSLFRPSNGIQRALGRVAVFADAAHALGAVRAGKRCGTLADFSSFSFHAVKNLTTAEGGALTWNLPFGEDAVPGVQNYGSDVPFIEGETWSEFLYRLSMLFSLHGQNKDALAKMKPGAWEYDIIGPWYKCNMTDIMASIGLAQLDRYPGMLERRHEIVRRYNEGLKGLDVLVLNHCGSGYCPPEEALKAADVALAGGSTAETTVSSHHLYLVRLVGRTRAQANRVIEQLAQRGVATNVHYKPLPMMTAYKALGFDISGFPNAFGLYENEITLPLHTRLSDEDVDYVIDNFREVLKEL